MKRLLSSLFLTALLSTIALPALAATLLGGEKLKVTSPIRDNAYLVGGEVSVTEPVSGDLLVAGGTVIIKTTVRDDVLAAGGSIVIEGNIGGDLRVVGGNITLHGTVGGDLIAAGGSVMVMDGSIVRGDVVLGGGNIILDGGVGGKVIARGGTVTLSKPVKGSVDIRAEEIVIEGSVDGAAVLAAKEITLSPDAKLMRDVRYWSAKGEQQFAENREQILGEVSFDPALQIITERTLERTQRWTAAGIVAAVIGVGGFFLLSAALVIFLLQLLTKTFFHDSAKFLMKKPWTSLLYGFLFFAATPVAALLFLLSVIGVPVALLLGTLYAFAIVFCKPVTALVLTRMIELKRGARWHGAVIFLVSVLLYLALKIVSFIPVVGWIIVIVTIFFAYGAVVATKWEKWEKIR